MVLPYSLGSSLASVPAAWFMSSRQARTKNIGGQRLIIATGLVISTIGFGKLDSHQSTFLHCLLTGCPCFFKII
jgi:hypothetical protein